MDGADRGPGGAVMPAGFLEVGAAQWLFLAAVALPLVLSALWPLRAARRVTTGLAPWAAAPALALALVHLVQPAAVPGLAAPGIFLGLSLALDPLAEPFFLVTALLWTAAGGFARAYHRDDPRRDQFFGFFTLTLTGNLGVVLAGDLLTFYLSFVVMTFAAYGLIVHRHDAEAQRAGRIYIILALFGEALILPALAALGAAEGGVMGFGPGFAGSWEGLGGAAPIVAALAIGGFAVKAGIAPLHLWLPLAHPVAPTAASALLSGAMIKAGLLGWLRVLPDAPELPAVGGALVIAGALTAFYGVVAGLAQDDAKTVLAYSSVSQMGYMAVGTGMILVAPEVTPLAVAAVALYAVHHGIAKGALFLSVGMADRIPGANVRWRALLRAGVLIPALALAGAPLTAGATAKHALKGMLGEVGGSWYAVLDPLLLAAAVGTTLLMVRFFVTVEARVGGSARAGAGWGRDLRQMAAFWGVLVVVGVTAPFWMTRLLALPAGLVEVRLFTAWIAALVPVVVGGAVGLAVLLRPGWLGPLGRLRIPPGDLVVPAEWIVRRALPPELVEAGGRTLRALERALRLEKALERVADRWLGGDLVLMRGPVLGSVLLVLVVVLAIMLVFGGG